MSNKQFKNDEVEVMMIMKKVELYFCRIALEEMSIRLKELLRSQNND